MTAAATAPAIPAVRAPRVVDLAMFGLLDHQRREVDDARRFKLLPQGRRRGKDRVMFYASLLGHGPERSNGRRRWPGILYGDAYGRGDVVWLARDYVQGKGIWHEEVEPRFGLLPDDIVHIDRGELTLHVRGTAGTLHFKSAKNVDSVRGLGRNVIGVVINEAAWMDLERIWRHVLRPILVDNRGWAIIASTTNSGLDGNTERRVPSFFNILCDQVEQGARSPKSWAMFAGDARDNPLIAKAEFTELVAEYPEGSVALDEEVYAKRLPPGGRHRAVEQFSRAVHVIDAFQIPPHWTRFAAFDWGFAHWAVFGGFAVDEDGTLYLEDTIWMRRYLPDKQAQAIKARWNPELFEFIAAGHDVRSRDRSKRDDTPSIEETFAEHDIELDLANIDREQGLAAMQDAFGWEERGPTGGPGDPRIYIFRTLGNMRVVEQVETLLLDEKNPRKPEEKDADPRTGAGGDDGFTMLRYGIATRRDRAPSLSATPVSAAWSPATLAAEAHRKQHDHLTDPNADVPAERDPFDELGLTNPGA